MNVSLDDFQPVEPLVGKTLVLETTRTYPCGSGLGTMPKRSITRRGTR